MKDTDLKKKMDPILLSLLAGILPVLAGIAAALITYNVQKIQAARTEKDKQELLAKNDSIKDELLGKYKEIADLNRTYSEKVDQYAKTESESSKEIIRLNQELVRRADDQAELQKQLAQKSDSIVKFNTGGDSYSYVDILYSGNNKYALMAYVSGEYPLHDLTINYFDSDELERYSRSHKNTYDVEEVNKLYISKFIPVFSPSHSVTHFINYIPVRNRISYYFSFLAPNGRWSEKLKMINNKKAYVVWREDGSRNVLLSKFIDKDFPKSELDDFFDIE